MRVPLGPAFFSESRMTEAEPSRRPTLRWPWPALAAWALAWAVFVVVRQAGGTPLAALAVGTVLGLSLATLAATRWRKIIVAGGFPLSALSLGAAGAVPAWTWLAAAGLLLLAYPLRAWRDAPFFPTAAHALLGLDRLVQLPGSARVLDAGCGLGHGLHALREVWPKVQLEGIEWSRPLAWLAARRCRWARVRRGDMWASTWAAHDLVYLFQRPESMPRAVQKARAEMRRGTWLVSLEFEAPGLRPHARLALPGQRVVWVYRIGDEGTEQGG